eukprot:123677-Ditylum_brightwellii.AAC.1
MVKNQVWTPIKLNKVPKGATILTSTWACKLKSNGQKRAVLMEGEMNKLMVYTMTALQSMHQLQMRQVRTL